MVAQAFGLEKNLMALAIGKADDLVLNGRAVSGAAATDLAQGARRAMQSGPDNIVHPGIGPRYRAGELR